MDFPIIILLAIVVAVVAYALGTYFRRRGDAPGAGLPPVLRPSQSGALLGKVNDRETQAVVNWLLSQAFEQTGVKVADEKLAYQRIVEAAQKAVRELKTQESTVISLPFLTADATGPKHFQIRLTREVIQELARY